MADIFIYSKEPLREARQDLEDDLEALLGSAGECTGGGQGERGWNIDLELFDPLTADEWVTRIVAALRERPVPADTCLVVWWSPDRHEEIRVYEAGRPTSGCS